eukprot:gnl/TRDRNA2_/TRDRNA2_169100_c0_seq10.p1 gnl/TRDRNA2_/TRDRNA2_169100_c0~~gnl/TRDRNA2_/TRDRNA2_169100_c0_seq10.p1  ORF type:complete len:245 (-),score=46.54 gnl/TRDRNA2_/TRDRNA2_169100_c0_seq10:74-808(-)
MIEACRESGVVFMDGVMFMHNPRLQAMKAVLDSSEFGSLQRIVGDFSFLGDEDFLSGNIRVDSAMEPLGALGDLGMYNIRLAMWAFGWSLPEKVSGIAHTMTNGVPTDTSSVLSFGDGKSVTFTNSFHTAFRQFAAITGTRQSIELSDFCLSGTESTTSSFKVYKKHGLTKYDMLVEKEISEEVVNYPKNQEVRMWEKFAELCESKDPEQLKFYADVSLNTQKVLDALMESVAKDGAPVTISKL